MMVKSQDLVQSSSGPHNLLAHLLGRLSLPLHAYFAYFSPRLLYSMADKGKLVG